MAKAVIKHSKSTRGDWRPRKGVKMPKMKTKSSVKKRYKLTGTGKLRYTKCNASHILTKKSTKRKRSLRKPGILFKSDAKRIKRLLNN